MPMTATTMTSLRAASLAALLFGLDGALVACPGPVEPPGDAGVQPIDAGEPDAGTQTETEPNDGRTTTEFNPFAIPGRFTGVIDPAGDADLLAVSLAAGDFWTWTLSPTGSALAPHLTIFFETQDANSPPTLVCLASAGQPAEQEMLVLVSGRSFAAVRDARNVPDPTGQGGPAFGWLLAARRSDPAPTAISFPSTVSGSLRHRFAVALYSFHASAGQAVDVDLRADRKIPRSDLDSRMSLFDRTHGEVVLVNDDDAGTTDSHIGGTLGEADYLLAVDNVNAGATDLSFELRLTIR